MKLKKLRSLRISMGCCAGRLQRIEIEKFPERHFWHEGYDKAGTGGADRPARSLRGADRAVSACLSGLCGWHHAAHRHHTRHRRPCPPRLLGRHVMTLRISHPLLTFDANSSSPTPAWAAIPLAPPLSQRMLDPPGPPKSDDLPLPAPAMLCQHPPRNRRTPYRPALCGRTRGAAVTNLPT